MGDDELNKAYEFFLGKDGFADDRFSEIGNTHDRVQYILSRGDDSLEAGDILKEMPRRSFVDSSWLENELKRGVQLGWVKKENGKYAPSEETKEMCDDFVLGIYRDFV